MPSYYLPELSAGSEIIKLDGEEYHHLKRVRRQQEGEKLLLNNGQGILAEAHLLHLGAKAAELKVLSCTEYQSFQPRLAIAFALLKNHHDELIIEKCTELGASHFFPFSSRYSVRSEGKNTLSRFRKIALSAIKQCDNPFLPMVHELQSLEKLLDDVKAKGYQPVICSELKDGVYLNQLNSDQDLCFIIGPEGGFSSEEFERMAELKRLLISALTLRAETAAIAIAAQFNAIFRNADKNSL